MNGTLRLPFAAILGAAAWVGAARTVGAQQESDPTGGQGPFCRAPIVALVCVGADEAGEVSALAEIPIDSGDCNPVGRLPYFGQWEAPWGGKPLGDRPLCQGEDAVAQAATPDATCCMPYSASGCGPTSLAMVLRAYGERVTPKTVGDAAVKAGMRRCNVDGVSPVALVAAGKLPAYVVDGSLDPGWRAIPTEGPLAMERLERLEAIVRGGRPVILGCAGCTVQNARGASRTFPGHYLVVSGVHDDGSFAVLDPSGFDGRSIERREVQLHARLHYVRRADNAPVEVCRR